MKKNHSKVLRVLVILGILIAAAVSMHLIANSSSSGGILEMVKKLHGN